MPDVLIRDMPEDMKERLASRARANGRSLSAEIKATLAATLAGPKIPDSGQAGLGTLLSGLIAPEDWSEDFIVERDRGERPPPDFS
jgi:plasmid stability protein